MVRSVLIKQLGSYFAGLIITISLNSARLGVVLLFSLLPALLVDKIVPCAPIYPLLWCLMCKLRLEK